MSSESVESSESTSSEDDYSQMEEKEELNIQNIELSKEKLAAYNAKIKKSGVIYLSKIPYCHSF